MVRLTAFQMPAYRIAYANQKSTGPKFQIIKHILKLLDITSQDYWMHEYYPAVFVSPGGSQ